ncbi:MAG: hypothetical protein ABTQ34_05515 [Bdellovibrionales bacterium]
MKAWKVQAIAAGDISRKPEKPTPQQVIRQAGYGDEFFDAASEVGLRVGCAKVKGDHIQITFVGTKGNRYSRTDKFPVVNEEPAPEADITKRLQNAATVIAQHNPAIRAKRYAAQRTTSGEAKFGVVENYGSLPPH